MGLSASMWTSVSGLLMHGEKMNVVGNNIANVSTVGFKAQRMDFQDFVYNNGFSASGPTQIGRGVSVAAVLGDFSQGSFETTNDATDLAISGRGFFQVKDPRSDQVWYTRAGDFRFDKEGYLQNPQGYNLQGWKIDNRDNPSLASGTGVNTNAITSDILRMGSPTDVKFDTWTVPPKQTSKITFQQYLSTQTGNDKAVSSTNPAFSLLETWDGGKTVEDPSVPPIASTGFATTATMKIYDEAGTAHTLTTYFDQVDSASINGLPNGYQVYEYMVTIDPSEDNRTFGGTYDTTTGQLTGATSFKETKMAGVMMVGQLIFDGSGNLVNQTAYTYNAADDQDYSTAQGPIDLSGQPNPEDLASWQPTQISNNGLPVFTPNFSGMPFANSVLQKQPTVAETFNQKDADNYFVEFDLGISNTAGSAWNSQTQTMGNIDSTRKVYDQNGGPVTQVTVNNGAGGTRDVTFDGTYSDMMAQANLQPGETIQTQYVVNTDYSSLSTIDNASTKRSDIPSQVTGSGNSTMSSLQNGYAYGNLNNYTVDQNGILYGYYSNGVTMPLYQIAMYDFTCTEGLRREGGNLFSATAASGNPKVGLAGENGLGTIQGYSIEQSNVDMAREFVQMISTQRGFQANSKGITTVDQMLETVIGMKR